MSIDVPFTKENASASGVSLKSPMAISGKDDMSERESHMCSKDCIAALLLPSSWSVLQ